MICVLRNGKRVWIDNLTDRSTTGLILGVLLCEFVRDYEYPFRWSDVIWYEGAR